VNLALIIKASTIKKYLFKQLAYYADGWFKFQEDDIKNQDSIKCKLEPVNTCKAKVLVVAKKHYQESWQSYASVSKKELQQIIYLQKDNDHKAATIFQDFKNTSIDGFDVKKITFDNEFMQLVGDKRILIPETELFIDNKANPIFMTLETPIGEMFTSYFSQKSSSSYAKGLVNNIDTFKMSSGLPFDTEHQQIKAQNYASFLFNQLIKQNLNVLIKKLAINPKAWFPAKDLHLIYWAPLLTACFFYLAANGYLWAKSYYIQGLLDEQSTEVRELITNKHAQDKQSHFLHALNDEFSKTSVVHEHWSIIYDLVESNMEIERINFAKNLLTVRGQADNASKVLTETSKNEYVASAAFKGNVLKSRGKDTFTLEIMPK